MSRIIYRNCCTLPYAFSGSLLPVSSFINTVKQVQFCIGSILFAPQPKWHFCGSVQTKMPELTYKKLRNLISYWNKMDAQCISRLQCFFKKKKLTEWKRACEIGLSWKVKSKMQLWSWHIQEMCNKLVTRFITLGGAGGLTSWSTVLK